MQAPTQSRQPGHELVAQSLQMSSGGQGGEPAPQRCAQTPCEKMQTSCPADMPQSAWSSQPTGWIGTQPAPQSAQPGQEDVAHGSQTKPGSQVPSIVHAWMHSPVTNRHRPPGH